LAYILLAAGDDGSGIVPFVVMIVVIVVLTIVKRIRQASGQGGSQSTPPPPRPRSTEDEAMRDRFSRPRPPLAPGQAPTLPDWMRPGAPPQPPQQQQQQPRRMPQAAPQPTHLPPIPSAQRPRPAASQIRPAAPVARAPFAPAEASGDLAEEVDQEMVAQQERRRQQDEDRSHRMAAIHLAKAPQLGGISRLRAKSVAPAAAPAVAAAQAAAPAPPLELDLRDPQQLRMAMIFHEILMPPKALRQAQDLWET
jgi:hypothetical protein